MELVVAIMVIVGLLIAGTGYVALDWQTWKLMWGYMWCKIA